MKCPFYGKNNELIIAEKSKSICDDLAIIYVTYSCKNCHHKHTTKQIGEISWYKEQIYEQEED